MNNKGMIDSDTSSHSKELSFEEVYYTFYRPIFFFTKQLITDEFDTQDLVADTFAKYYKQRHGFHQLEQAKSFLFTTARNAALNHLRHQKLKTDKGTDIAEALQQQSAEDHFFDKLVLTELMIIVSEEVQRLPEKQQAVFRLSYFEDKSTEEIAQELHITPEAVYNNKKRAVEKLRVILKNKDLRLYLAFIKIFIA